MGRDSVVGVATRYVPDGPGIESRWKKDFPHRSKLAAGPTRPPVQWITGLFTGGGGGVKWQERGVVHPPPSSAEIKKRVELRAIPVLPLWAFMACYMVKFTITFTLFFEVRGSRCGNCEHCCLLDCDALYRETCYPFHQDR